MPASKTSKGKKKGLRRTPSSGEVAAAAAAAIALIGAVRYRKAIGFAIEHRKLISEVISIDWRHDRLLSRAYRDAIVTGNTLSTKHRLNALKEILIKEAGDGFRLRYFFTEYGNLTDEEKEEYDRSTQAVNDIKTMLQFIEIITGRNADKEIAKTGKDEGMAARVYSAIHHALIGDEIDVIASKNSKIVMLESLSWMAGVLNQFIQYQKRPKSRPGVASTEATSTLFEIGSTVAGAAAAVGKNAASSVTDALGSGELLLAGTGIMAVEMVTGGLAYFTGGGGDGSS